MRQATRYLRVTGAWTCFIVAIWSLLAFGNQGVFPWDAWVGMVGMALAFAAYAGGSAAGGTTERGSSAMSTVFAVVATATLVWVLLAFVRPIVEFALQGSDSILVFGPETPRGLERLREYLVRNPPIQPRPTAGDRLQWPVAWVDYTLAQPRVIAALTLLGAAVGAGVAYLTQPLAVGLRRRLRWSGGLLSAVAILVTDDLVREWLIADPSGRGHLRSWFAILPHALIVAGTALVASRARRG